MRPKAAHFFAFPGEGVVPEQADQVQASETGGGGTREPAEEEGEPPHQQMAHRHQAEQLWGHRRDLGGLKPPSALANAALIPTPPRRTNIIYYDVILLSLIRQVRGKHKNLLRHSLRRWKTKSPSWIPLDGFIFGVWQQKQQQVIIFLFLVVLNCT